MNFLYPGFLFALLAVLIPVLIHLFNFRKFKKVYFSNVLFLKEIKAQNSSREQLKNLLILLCRILTIIFLVLAFARPFLNSKQQASINDDNVVSIYVDNSYSMDAVNKDGSLLDEAKRRAKEVAANYQINDKFQLLTNDFEGKHQRLLNKDEFLQALQEVKISAANRDLQQIINRQQSVFAGNYNRFAYVISDFQKGFAGDDAITKDVATNLSLVKLNATALPNIAVDSVWFLSPVHQPGASEKIAVRLRNYGNDDAVNVPIKLTINNQQKAVGSANIAADATVVDTLSYSGLSAGWQKAVVSIKDYPLTFDDEFLFSFNVVSSQNVLVINGQTNNFIKAAFTADPYFKLTEVSENNINYSTFGDYSLLVLNGLVIPSSGLAQALKTYSTAGGSIVVFPNTEAEVAPLNSFLSSLGLPQVNPIQIEKIRVSQIELKHPLFKDVFDAMPKNIDLPQLNRYFTFNESSNINKETILQLPGGRFYLAKFGIGSGQVFLWASGLEEADGNLAKHPLFVPIIYKIAFESAQDLPLFYVLGSQQTITQPAVRLGANQTLKMVANGFEAIPELSYKNGKTELYVADQIKEVGFYDVNVSDSTLSVVAFNNNRKESDMNYQKENDLIELFGDSKTVHFIDAKTDSITSAIAEKNNGTELWKLCLILSLVFIAAEVLLIRFFNPTNKYQSS
jgi:hypothetical protein